MADTTFEAKVTQSHAADNRLFGGSTTDSAHLADSSRVAGTWVNKDKLAYGQLLIHTIRLDTRECEVSMDCQIGQSSEKFFGFYYSWPNNSFYLVLQKAENGLKEYYMFISLEQDGPDGPEYLTTDMTGSIRYTRP